MHIDLIIILEVLEQDLIYWFISLRLSTAALTGVCETSELKCFLPCAETIEI